MILTTNKPKAYVIPGQFGVVHLNAIVEDGDDNTLSGVATAMA